MLTNTRSLVVSSSKDMNTTIQLIKDNTDKQRSYYAHKNSMKTDVYTYINNVLNAKAKMYSYIQTQALSAELKAFN